MVDEKRQVDNSDMRLESSTSSDDFSSLLRQAQFFGASGFAGGTQVSRSPLLYIDPMFDPILLMFPKENIKELNRRLRHYYTYHPIVNNLINLHSELSLSDFDLRCEDKEIEKVYNDFAKRINLLEHMVQWNRDYYLLGEAIVVGNWDQYNLTWQGFYQYPPENVDVHAIYTGGESAYFLKPDDEIRKLLTSVSEIDQLIASQLPEEFRESMMVGRPMHLPNEQVIHYARKPSGYSRRGQSIVLSVLKDLIYEDKIRILQYTFVDRTMHPIKLWKLGREGGEGKGFIPSKKHFDRMHELLVTLKNDPDFDMVTHPFVKMEVISQHTAKEDLIKQFEFVQKRILIGLFANEAMLAEAASPYATASVSMRIVMHRYMTQRTILENIVKEKVFKPIAKARKYINKSGEYILPTFFWRQLNILTNTAEREFLLKLREKGEIPLKYIAEMFGWPLDSLKQEYYNEIGTVLDKDWRAAKVDVLKDKKASRDFISGKPLNKIVEERIEEQTLFGKKPAEKPKADLPEDGLGEPSLDLPSGGASPPKGPGRPPLPEDEKKPKYEPATVPPSVESPREKLGTELPTPIGEGGPTAKEE